jgi:hypothetical protein
MLAVYVINCDIITSFLTRIFGTTNHFYRVLHSSEGVCFFEQICWFTTNSDLSQCNPNLPEPTEIMNLSNIIENPFLNYMVYLSVLVLEKSINIKTLEPTSY